MNQSSYMTPKDRFKRMVEMDKWLKQKEAADREFFNKPWWVQQSEEGDYHYSDGDMDWEEYLNEREEQ